jgi:hypothetical protein
MRLVVLLAVVALPGVLLAPVWRLAGLGAGEDDILYYYPARVFFHETICAGHWPWLNPWTGLGRPFVADPQTAFWYPFTWLFAVLPPLRAYPISLWMHYSLALWGMYRLLRALELDQRAALLGGIAFAFCGFLLAHRAHLTMQHAAAWTPWVFWRLHRYTLSPTSTTSPERKAGALRRLPDSGTQRLAVATVVLALQGLAGHVQIMALTALGALVFLLSGPQSWSFAPSAGRARVGRGIIAARWLIACVCAAGLLAVQWLPTLDYVRLCTRVERGYRDFVENSWHPASAIGFLLPMLFGQRTPNFFGQAYWGPSHQVEQTAYAGLLPLLLAALALRRGWRFDPRRRPWVSLAAFGLLLALGQYGPICPFLYWIPGSRLFRCPARTLLLVNLAVAALAAITFHDLGAAPSPLRARLRATAVRWTSRPLTTAALFVAIPVALILLALPLIDAQSRAAALRAVRPWNPAVWVPLVMAFASLTALGAAVRRWRQPRLLWLLPAVTALDLAVIGWTIDVPAGRSHPSELLSPGGAPDWMEPLRDGPHRLWVVTGRQGRLPGEYVRPVEKAVANTNILRHIASLTDYGPLQPGCLQARFGFKPWGEAPEAARLLTDTTWMRLYNVGWILLCDQQWPAPAGCDLNTITADGWRLYRNPTAAGDALLEDPTQPGAVRVCPEGPTRLTVWVDTWPTTGPADVATAASGPWQDWPRLVVSRLALPGWTARCDGRPMPIEQVADGLIGVRVPPGQAVEIRFNYSPPGLYLGMVISLLSALVLATFVLGSLSAGVRVRPPRRRKPKTHRQTRRAAK